ncbi:transketolase C-terminal domain-containing protein [Nakamurella deserti]|uniref:transketolase C-terminal domain-containing protein n=1 Tax=Nakamurella deserti TaxID=2164074 RepID=UPI000DBE404F
MATGSMREPAAAEKPAAGGAVVAVTAVPTVKPLDHAAVAPAADGGRRVVALENRSSSGGLTAVATSLIHDTAGAATRTVPAVRRVGLSDESSAPGRYPACTTGTGCEPRRSRDPFTDGSTDRPVPQRHHRCPPYRSGFTTDAGRGGGRDFSTPQPAGRVDAGRRTPRRSSQLRPIPSTAHRHHIPARPPRLDEADECSAHRAEWAGRRCGDLPRYRRRPYGAGLS